MQKDFIASTLENKQIDAELPTIHAAGKQPILSGGVSVYNTSSLAKGRILNSVSIQLDTSQW